MEEMNKRTTSLDEWQAELMKDWRYRLLWYIRLPFILLNIWRIKFIWLFRRKE